MIVPECIRYYYYLIMQFIIQLIGSMPQTFLWAVATTPTTAGLELDEISFTQDLTKDSQSASLTFLSLQIETTFSLEMPRHPCSMDI